MRTFIMLMLWIAIAIYAPAQGKDSTQYLAICQEDKGCTFSEIKMPAKEVDILLGKRNFWTQASPSAILIMNGCESSIEDEISIQDIHQRYGGTNESLVIKKIDLKKYLKDEGCITMPCSNETKKISFYVQTEDVSGNGYFFLNIKAGEAFMPNASFQQFLSQAGAGQLVIDQFIRNGAMENYVIAEGVKYKVAMPVGVNMSAVISKDAINAQRFADYFTETGNTRSHLNTALVEKEYIGTDNEGSALQIWIVPSYDVCLPVGKFDMHGFYNLGYIAVDGMTYLLTEMKNDKVHVKLTAINNGTYNFNTAGYKPLNLPGNK